MLAVGLFSAIKPTTAQAADTKSGLVAEWKFDGDINESVNSFATENGAKSVSFVDGVFGKAAKFDGKSQYLRVAHDDKLNLENDDWKHPSTTASSYTEECK